MHRAPAVAGLIASVSAHALFLYLSTLSAASALSAIPCRHVRKGHLAMNQEQRHGLCPALTDSEQRLLIPYINLKLTLLGCPTVETEGGSAFVDMAAALLSRHEETDRLLADYLCP